MHNPSSGAHQPRQAPPPWKQTAVQARGEDLVLAPASRERLEALAGLLRDRRRAGAPGGAVLALFTGESGTGKTMVAHVLAGELGAPIIEVDAVASALGGVAALAATVWRVLRDGEQTGAVIVFNDAGAILGRSRTGDDGEAIDLTARCADYPGLIIFCSRAHVRLTPAEQERFAAMVEFPVPEAPDRAQLWRRWLSPLAELSNGDIEFLAQSFRLSGGAIEACCRVARRRASEAGHPIRRADVAAGLEIAYSKWVISPTTRAALDTLRADSDPDRPGRAAPAPGRAVPRSPRPRRAPWRRQRSR